MNWYRRAQEDDMMQDSVRDFVLEDASPHLSPLSTHASEFRDAVTNIFAVFGFSPRCWSEADDNNTDFLVRVYPTKECATPTSYTETAEMRKNMAGLDREKAAKLVAFLKTLPEVEDVFLSPALHGCEDAVFNIRFNKEIPRYHIP